MDERIPDRARRGRGAVSNHRSSRFTALQRERTDDGWAGARSAQGACGDAADAPADDDALEGPSPQTVIGIDRSKSALAWNGSPDVPFDRSLNPYKGCEHGCVYCFARPTHAYLDLSPGLDFETRIFAKPDAPDLLRRELAKPGYRPATITLGANTDPYQPAERDHGISRALLAVLEEARHPVCIVTKGAAVTRDADILGRMAARNLARVMVSVTTLDRALCRTLEPRAPQPARRLRAVRALTDAGVPTGVLAAPMIPALNDWELERILEAAADHGADTAGYVLLRLPHEIKHLMEEWLDAHAPGKKDHVLSLIRQARDGALYDAGWGTRMKGTGAYADLLARRFRRAAKRHGLSADRWDLDTTQFTPPAKDPRQGALF
ncbi:radical SAM protein [Rhodovibrio sodomensis]|uniref:Radical SAM protein n=1 Tax=Rhodovibrio sodomensis TaxID=1088 RepID=A0ABS1DM66_9PROT|nr:PA0069 family radical SAM protein [Rhodovibrio sodomensis]MBK1671106.1 radical SAM protein [Rhodovibrio sodomensis]